MDSTIFCNILKRYAVTIFVLVNESGTIVPLLQKKQRICRCFLHGCDSLGKIELPNEPFRKAIPCIFTITQIKQLYH